MPSASPFAQPNRTLPGPNVIRVLTPPAVGSDHKSIDSAFWGSAAMNRKGRRIQQALSLYRQRRYSIPRESDSLLACLLDLSSPCGWVHKSVW
jgi:hypothetical protein